MRAIIICLTDLSQEELRDGLQRIGWWYSGTQDSPEATRQKQEILSRVVESDQADVAETFWYVIHNPVLDVWGIVNSPSKGRVTVRLQHADVTILKRASEDFVRKTQKTLGEPDRRGIDHLDFHPELQILPPHSNVAAARGEILTETRLHTLIEERRLEFRVARSALIVALIIFAVTTPPAEAPLKAMNEEWGKWFYGILERTGTAAITTFMMFCLDLVQRLRHLKENTIIRWL